MVFLYILSIFIILNVARLERRQQSFHPSSYNDRMVKQTNLSSHRLAFKQNVWSHDPQTHLALKLMCNYALHKVNNIVHE